MTADELMEYERDIREATIAYPKMEMREAYVKFMTEIKKKDPKPMLSTNDPKIKAAIASITKKFKKACENPNNKDCPGEMVLSGVCNGCAAGKKGFRTQWECEECLFREFSPKTFFDWYEELSKSEV